ncbi:MAG: T9SS type A sorting domain-containing protein [Bacteroidales bacterium]
MDYHNRGKYYFSVEFFYYNNRIMCWGYATDSITQKNQIWLSEFDENLTILHDTILGNGDSLVNLYTASVLVTSQNKLLITMGFVPYMSDTTVNTMVCLLDSNFTILKERSIFSHFGFNGFSVVEMTSNQSFHVVTIYGITQIKQSDLMLDSIVWNCDGGALLGGRGAKTINDSTYIHPLTSPFMTGVTNGFGLNTYLFIRNKNGKTKDSLIIGNMQKTYDISSSNHIVDFFTTDSIFITGNNYSLDSSITNYEDNTIFLWNIKLNGQVNWQKYYGIGKKFIVSDITKTSDGGCFLVGVVWDWHHFSKITTDLFFLKLDKNGNVCGSIGINEPITESEILVYPNPARDYINFDMGMYKDFQLSLYNSVGQVIFQKDFTLGNNTIYIQNFKQGIYYYRLINDKGKVISGKFVKE